MTVMEEMKAALQRNVGTGVPLQVRDKQAGVQIVFIRGFADEKHNIVLISQTADSLGVNIIEVKHIDAIFEVKATVAAMSSAA